MSENGKPRPSAPGRICLVTQEWEDLHDGSIGTYYELLARELSAHGWHVHVLYAGPCSGGREAKRAAKRMARAGVNWHWVRQFALPARYAIRSGGYPHYDPEQERARFALQALHQEHGLDLVEFPERGGLGFRTVQAKRAGLALDGVPILVTLHGPSQWLRQAHPEHLTLPSDLHLDFAERYAFEYADMQASTRELLRNWAEEQNWKVRTDCVLAPCPLPCPVISLDQWVIRSDDPVELVYVGRLDAAGCVKAFTEAVRRLDRPLQVTFLGGAGGAEEERAFALRLNGGLGDRHYKWMPGLGWKWGMDYLRADNRLGVIVSSTGPVNYPAIDCAIHGIPFLTCIRGNGSAFVGDEALRARLCFEPNGKDLTRCLMQWWAMSAEQRRQVQQQARQAVEQARQEQHVAIWYEQRQQRRIMSAPATPAVHRQPLVSVLVTHYNLGAYLPEALTSLAAQTYQNREVLVMDDGSTDEESCRVFAEQERRYPEFRFLRQENAGVSHARNRLLDEAHGEYALMFDADNIAAPEMISRLVRAMERCPECAALTTYQLGFAESTEIIRGQFWYSVTPSGGPLGLVLFGNSFGDGNALYRVAAIRAVGGYDPHPENEFEDYDLLVRMALMGYEIGVVPEHLCYYRHRADSRSRTADLMQGVRYWSRQLVRAWQAFPAVERPGIWEVMVGLREQMLSMQRALDRAGQLETQVKAYQGCLRYRLADRVNYLVRRVPMVHPVLKGLVKQARHIRRRAA